MNRWLITLLVASGTCVGAEIPARWITVRELTETSHIYEGNWIGTAVERLRTRIAREGYSDDVMSEFQQIKERLSQPVTQSPRGGDATGYR